MTETGYEDPTVVATLPGGTETRRDQGEDRDRRILEECREAKTLDQIAGASNVPRSTVHRRLRRLYERGLISHQGELYLTTDSGKRSIERGGQTSDDLEALLRLWPWLALLPTNLHRAVLVLILFARASRRDGVTDDRNPSVILVGGTQRMKSWTAKAACFLCGSSPEDCRVLMPEVRGRGLIARMDSKGKLAYRSDALQGPILWLEEFSLADPRVKRDVEAMVHGVRAIRIENEVVDVPALPVIELNPLVKEGSLEDRTGFDTPRLRRCLVADFTSISLSAKQRSESPQVLDRIAKKFSPVDLPPAKKVLDPRVQALVDSALSECISPRSIDYVDPGRLMTLVAGAAGLLPDLDAANVTLRAYLTVAESTGYVKADWRARFADLKPTEPSTIAFPIAPAVLDRPHKEPGRPRESRAEEVLPFDLDAVLIGLKHQVELAGFVLPENEAEVGSLLHIARRLSVERISPQDFGEIASQVGRLADLREHLHRLGGDEVRLRELVLLGESLEDLGVPLASVSALAEAIVDGSQGEVLEVRRAADYTLSIAKRGLTVDQEVRTLEARRDALGVQCEDLVKQVGRLKRMRKEEESKLATLACLWTTFPGSR